MSFRVRRILVAIRDERLAAGGPLRKAAALARANGARIELFHAINEPEALSALRRESLQGHPVQDIIDTLARRAQKRLERRTAQDDFRDLKVSCSATWDFPPHEAVIRRVMATRADLIA